MQFKPTTAGKPQTGRHAPQRPGFRRGPPGAGTGEQVIRVRMPKTHLGELIGFIQENYGSKLLVRCVDGHTRICRIPGKIRYKVRVRLGDVVIVKKWTVQENEKGDYLYRYRENQIPVLIRKGLIKKEDLI